MALGDLLKTLKSPNQTLGNEMDRYLLKLQGRPFLDQENDREKNVWHPSEISTTDCLRRLAFSHVKTPKSNDEKIRAQLRRLFDVGHHFGYQIQGYYWDMGKLLGKWKCQRCEHKWFDMVNASPRRCPNCDVKLYIWENLKYEEVPVRILRGDRKPIAGHADGVVVDNSTPSGMRVIEIKTIKAAEPNWTEEMKATKDYFEKLNQPLDKHLYQANIYMYGLQIMDGIFHYGNKNNQEMKNYNIRLFQPFLDKQFIKLDTTEAIVDSGKLPERIVNDKKSEDCKYCPWRTLCYSKDDLTLAEVDGRQNLDEVK